ncbi:Hypothetical protein A7982_09666 [Minicystis rosea]|nr:Hypothetical protein A7982_09666 [Minicystis rosea]
MNEPEWLSALRADEDLAARFELRFLDAEASAEVRRLAHQGWEGKFQGALAEQGHERIERATPVGGGLARRRRISGVEEIVVLWLDPEEDQLFAGFTLAQAPALWLPLGTTRASVTAALAPYDVKDTPPVSVLPRVHRWLKQAAPEERELIEQVCDRWEPWLDDAKWQNGNVDDPWAASAPARNMVEQSIQLREAAQERPGRVPSTSYRTLWSRSVLTIEYHPFHCVFVVRHAPAPTGLPEAVLDDLTGGAVPSDVPVDVAASLLRSGNVTLDLLDGMADAWEPAHSIARAALLPGEPPAGADLRRRFDQVKDDVEQRSFFVKLALHYQHHWVLLDIAAAEPELVRAPDLAPLFQNVVPAAVLEVL